MNPSPSANVNGHPTPPRSTRVRIRRPSVAETGSNSSLIRIQNPPVSTPAIPAGVITYYNKPGGRALGPQTDLGTPTRSSADHT